MDDDQLDVVQTTLSPEEDAAADAAFESGYAATVGNTTAGGQVLDTDANGKPLVNDAGKTDDDDAEEDPAAKAAAEEAARLAAEAEARAAAEAEANAPASITKAQAEQLLAAAALVPQLQQELARTRDTTAGKIGTLHQQLADIKAQAAQGKAPTIGQLKRISAEFPELGQLLMEDLAEQFGGAAAAPGAAGDPPGDGATSGQPGDAPANQPPADPLSDPRVVQRMRQESQQVVDTLHPDWKDLARTDDFKAWRTTLPPQAQHLLATSWRADVLVPAFNDFKAWKANQAAQAQAAAAAAASASKQRDKRLEHAMTPTSGRPTGTNAVDEDAAFLDGFNGARR
jgi:hypothetical protein